MAEKKNIPIGYVSDASLTQPFILKWSEVKEIETFDGSTTKVEDTAFSDVIGSIAPNDIPETISTTQSVVNPGELADTSF
jgi:hypothetical protein